MCVRACAHIQERVEIRDRELANNKSISYHLQYYIENKDYPLTVDEERLIMCVGI